MKKFLYNLIAVIVIAVSSCLISNISTAGTSLNSSNNEKVDLIIVRTVENGVAFVNVYTDSGTLILKFEEL